jgi:hypothetical protein
MTDITPEDPWNKEFPITSVTRKDLVDAGLRRSAVQRLTDEQMRRIASKMADYYCDQGFWEHAITAAEYVTERSAQTLSE